ncbi:uncharacterized protein EV420DRAFT_1711319 [Desarmillaria tabescens]|uniref:Uncharacterized protein n=1 Tax=Armillaria tabescens TaxID=1929756 RepID=A0AA39MWU7_ARMTA|nr:uncharacterized protein EV420DRAFT_1711319 [Desarmillaria tabescens]KAK0448969.1 hypothetical protein EV420DRAFT_1711319 [Desarmillaria tabescens]
MPESITLSSGSNHKESDDPLNGLRSKKRELTLQADNSLHNSRRIHVKTDAYSCMEIKDMLESLNCDIMQLAALISDKLKFNHAYAKTLEGLANLHDAAENMQIFLGRRVAELLMGRFTKEMQGIVIQTVIQAVLAKTCRWLIQRWSVSHKGHKFFASSYKKFREINSLETVAQWRAATRGIAKYGPQFNATREYALQRLIDNLLDVLRIAGWQTSAPKEGIERLFGDRIRELVALTIGVDRAIMEGAMTQDLDLFMPKHDSTYDPNMMVNINQGPNAVVSDGEVAVSVNIGLKLNERLRDEGKSKESKVTNSEAKVLLKAKVVLNKALGI